MVDDTDFEAGFRQGYFAIMGKNAGVPGTPGRPGASGRITSFQQGLLRGVQAAKARGAKLPWDD